MKKKLLLFFLICSSLSFSQITWQGGTTPEETDANPVLVFDATGTPLESHSGTIYAHIGVTLDDTNDWQNVIGDWGNNSTQPSLTPGTGETYTLTLSPNINDFFLDPSGTITAINVVFRSADGGTQTSDLDISVGAFQVTMINPNSSGLIIVSSGGQTQIIAQNTNGAANYELFVNESSFHTSTTTFYQSPFITNITDNKYCELRVTQGGSTISKFFTILVNSTASQAIPPNLDDGINYNSGDDTKAILVLDAEHKDFVYVAGSFNNWQPTSAYAMKKDPSSDKFWIELTGLTSGQVETYQYWVGDLSPISNSPKLVKTADPFSTLVLSPFDDPWISETTFPGLLTTYAYPSGQEREVTVLQTNQPEYNWQVPNFNKPKKEDLIIYEVLIRDFDSDRNFQDLIDKIDYFKNLNINAIELMPVMEYEGNESWGYNTSFHLALDKFYGTEAKLKEFIDLCHQNGIAVILDVALNHAFGRNPMNRMWMDDPEGDGWGEPSSENPYMNEVATHSYSVGSDFNHQSLKTQYYSERVIKRWVEDFKIDGFRWDLTKGFTQECTSSNESCTNGYRSDRVAILKDYADYSWSLDPDHYVIFEHLGGNTEETEWAEYRIGEGKGIMLWGKMTDPYNQMTMGYNSSNDISGMGHNSRGWSQPRLVGYSESHDEERLMYKNVAFGASGIQGNLNAALNRMDALGAISLPIPGPKMIWHFGELGMDNSLWLCNDGITVNEGNDDCKLSTKPQPQWAENWLGDANRNQIYNAWSRINEIKINEDVFEGDYSIDTNTLTPRIGVFNTSLPTTELRDVVIIANFNTSSTNVNPFFPYGGTWYDLMDETGSTTISGSSTSVNLEAGGFKIYGNEASTLSNNDVILEDNSLKLYPNPTSETFAINKVATNVSLYDLTGKIIKEFRGNFNKGKQFNISEFANSIYIVEITNTQGLKQTTKLIKL